MNLHIPGPFHISYDHSRIEKIRAGLPIQFSWIQHLDGTTINSR